MSSQSLPDIDAEWRAVDKATTKALEESPLLLSLATPKNLEEWRTGMISSFDLLVTIMPQVDRALEQHAMSYFDFGPDLIL
jgi:hypothetical protein